MNEKEKKYWEKEERVHKVLSGIALVHTIVVIFLLYRFITSV